MTVMWLNVLAKRAFIKKCHIFCTSENRRVSWVDGRMTTMGESRKRAYSPNSLLANLKTKVHGNGNGFDHARLGEELS